MSAIHMQCEKCGGRYIAGVVGTTPWPAHVCPEARIPREDTPARAIGRALEKGISQMDTQVFLENFAPGQGAE